MARLVDRRSFLKGSVRASAGLAAVLYAGHSLAGPVRSPNEKLNLAAIGVRNRALDNIQGLGEENFVALCDVDEGYLSAAAMDFPAATRYADFRKLLDAEAARIDGVVISTPDHLHAPATSIALDLGKHVYCEKPLTHTVAEARALARLAGQKRVATQMGIQIHAEPNYRRVVERIRSGAIGKIREVYCWCNKGWSDGRFSPAPDQQPAGLDWDLWQGPAAARPWSPNIHPANWRRFWEYGSGTFGDMACHVMDLPFWALELQHPVRVSAEGPELHPDGAPAWCRASYEFQREGEPPLRFHWADGGENFPQVRSVLVEEGRPLSDWGLGVLFIGDEGMLAADYGRHLLLPEEKFREIAAPPVSLPDSPGHHREWALACKQGTPTSCDFAYSSRLTETVLLGIVAYRSQQPVVWDPATMKVNGNDRAQELLTKSYRPGFEVVGLGRGD